MEFFNNYKYLIVPFGVWVAIQIFKFIWEIIVSDKAVVLILGNINSNNDC